MYLVMLVPQSLTYRVKYIVNTTIVTINIIIMGVSVDAQILPDETLNTQVNLVDGQQKITGGIERDTNLFHSFKEFSPTADFVTHFDNNSNIVNIFTRVTGNSASLIDGLIRTNGNASLFILNPAGIIFGDNAQLEIGGSFITTTAESIIFADGTKFDTSIKQTPPLLTVSIPIGLQYGNSPGAISSNNNNSVNLEVSPGNTIAFLGGNIELQNISIKALSGSVEIGSIAEGERLNISPNSNWQFQYDKVSKFNDIEISQKSNDIEISQKSEINTSGEQGTINLRGQDIVLSSGLQILNITNQDTVTKGGEISLIANNYIDLNDIFLATRVETTGKTQIPVTKKGGDIIISAKDLQIRNGSIITAETLNRGPGGSILINAKDSLELSGFNDFFPSLILSSTGNKIKGEISGKGGNIKINTSKLVVSDGATIDSSTFGTGNAGNIEVNADESILIFGNDFFSQRLKKVYDSGLFSSSGVEGLPPELEIPNFGQGGSIKVTSSKILLRDNASITVRAFFENGDAGDINISADNIVLFDESNINADANLGIGGNITITTQGLFTQNNPEDVITASSERGIDGIVEIKTPDINSKLETSQLKLSPLAAEESIYTGCSLGTDFEANKFSYIGRGGMRKSPFESVGTHEFIGDLGLDDSAFPAAELNTNKNPNNQMIDQTTKSIIEATTWIVNAQGNVELIAQASNDSFPSDCLFK